MNTPNDAVSFFRASRHGFKGRLLAALALAFVANMAIADDAAPALASATATQQPMQARQNQGDAGERADWNVDYPSQLGPQPLTRATAPKDAATATASASPVALDAHAL